MFEGGYFGKNSNAASVGREVPLKGRAFKIEISKVSGSAFAAEICTGPHNRLLRRQHCSSLCSQSEGYEHVANMTSALGHNLVGFSAHAWPPQSSPPSLCEQSELQCFAPGLRQMSARCPLLRCRLRHVIWLNPAQIFFWILNILPLCLSANAVPDASVSRPRFDRGSSQMRSYHVPDSVVPRPRCADKS